MGTGTCKLKCVCVGGSLFLLAQIGGACCRGSRAVCDADRKSVTAGGARAHRSSATPQPGLSASTQRDSVAGLWYRSAGGSPASLPPPPGASQPAGRWPFLLSSNQCAPLTCLLYLSGQVSAGGRAPATRYYAGVEPALRGRARVDGGRLAGEDEVVPGVPALRSSLSLRMRWEMLTYARTIIQLQA